ncbi:hypothetical protein SORBI_3005G184050 [Sorghum bicolor]|uniref:Uncharacterized protein n=1 Tax=Sorghum bicolor TaxID=4558 RepID=A0A1Z5RJC0_SORBI|nr:hypothetical protein SORBI_3005G184050 [Sorghum bicolor]
MRHRCEGTTNNQEARGASSVLTLPSRLLDGSISDVIGLRAHLKQV